MVPVRIVVVLLTCYLHAGTASLRIYNITVPEVVVAGNSTVIDCQWKAKGHPPNGGGLYSLKWYHGLHEFYRWTPDDVTPMKVFPAPEEIFSVSGSRSRQGRVFLEGVRRAAGQAPLRCEISGEPPFFQTDTQWATMGVVVPPQSPPTLTGARPLYPLDGEVEVTCSSPPSVPHPTYAFTLNGGKVPESHLEPLQVEPDPPTGLNRTTQTLRFSASLALARSGCVLVRCSAAVAGVSWQEAELVVHVDVPDELRRPSGFSLFGGAATPTVHGPAVLCVWGAVWRMLYM